MTVDRLAVELHVDDRATPILDVLALHFARARRLGYGPAGRFCLDCDAPLFTDELLHVPPDPDALSVTDAVRWAGSPYNRTGGAS